MRCSWQLRSPNPAQQRKGFVDNFRGQVRRKDKLMHRVLLVSAASKWKRGGLCQRKWCGSRFRMFHVFLICSNFRMMISTDYCFFSPGIRGLRRWRWWSGGAEQMRDLSLLPHQLRGQQQQQGKQPQRLAAITATATITTITTTTTTTTTTTITATTTATTTMTTTTTTCAYRTALRTANV